MVKVLLRSVTFILLRENGQCKVCALRESAKYLSMTSCKIYMRERERECQQHLSHWGKLPGVRVPFEGISTAASCLHTFMPYVKLSPLPYFTWKYLTFMMLEDAGNVGELCIISLERPAHKDVISGAVYIMDHEVVWRPCKICDWLLNSFHDHFDLYQRNIIWPRGLQKT